MTGVIRIPSGIQTEAETFAFIIRVRIKRWWMVHRWLPVIAAIGKLDRELMMQPMLGFLGSRTWFGNTIILTQYWRSLDALDAFAQANAIENLPAWAKFNRLLGNRKAVEVFHEIYQIAPGQFNRAIIDMPPAVLRAYAQLIEARGQDASASLIERGLLHASPATKEPYVRDRALAFALAKPSNEGQFMNATESWHKYGQRQVDTKPGQGPDEVKQLIELIEEALQISDSMGQAFVSIDLCSALDKLEHFRNLESP